MCKVGCHNPSNFPPPQPLNAAERAEDKAAAGEVTGDHVLQPFYEPSPWQAPKTLDDQRADAAAHLRGLREDQVGYFNGDMYSTAHEGVSLSGLRGRLAAAKQRLKRATDEEKPDIEHEIGRYEREISDRTDALAELEQDIAKARERLQSLDMQRLGAKQRKPRQGLTTPCPTAGVSIRR